MPRCKGMEIAGVVRSRRRLPVYERKEVMKYNVRSADVLPVGDDTPDGERKMVIYWPYDFTARVGNSNYRGFTYLRIRLENKSKAPTVVALVVPCQGKQGLTKALEKDVVLAPVGDAGDNAEYVLEGKELNADGRVLVSERVNCASADGVGGECLRVMDLQLENPDSSGGDKLAICEVEVEVCYKCGSAGDEGRRGKFLLMRSIKGEPLGLGAYGFGALSSAPMITTVPDEGYPQLGYTWGGDTDWVDVELMWFKQGKPTAQFRWRALEDGKNRICIPSLVLSKLDNYYQRYYATTAAVMEWAYSYDRGGWYLAQPNGDMVTFFMSTQPSEVVSCHSRVPVIVYSTDRVTRVGSKVALEEVVAVGTELGATSGGV